MTFPSFPGPAALRHFQAYAQDGRRQGQGCPGPLAPLRASSLTCGNATRKNIEFLLLSTWPGVQAGVSAGVPLLWPGTDVRFDPGDEHGGIVPLGTDRNAAVIIMPANL